MAWVDYKKAYDMVPHSWIIKCLDLFGVAGLARKKKAGAWLLIAFFYPR